MSAFYFLFICECIYCILYGNPVWWPSRSACQCVWVHACVCVCVWVLFKGPARGRINRRAGWWLSVVMQVDSLMTLLTPEHTSRRAPGTPADVHTHTIWHLHIYVWYMAWCFLEKTLAKMGREKNLSVNDPGTNNGMKSCSFGHHFILFKNKQECVDLGFFVGRG